jgi:hypothetical protein
MIQFNFNPPKKFNVINKKLQLLTNIKKSFSNKPHVETDRFKFVRDFQNAASDKNGMEYTASSGFKTSNMQHLIKMA